MSNFFVFNNNPSNEIKVSLPQSKNHGYPAIMVCNLKLGLHTIKLSIATKNSFNNSSLFFCALVFEEFLSIKSAFSISFSCLLISFSIKSLTSISSIFSSN